MAKRAIAIVGRGRVGSAFANALRASGERVLVLDRAALGRQPARRLDVNRILIAVADDAIRTVAGVLAQWVRAGYLPAAGVALHVSGSQAQSALSRLARRGWSAGIFHPVAVFPEAARRFSFHQVPIAIAGDERAVRAARALANRLRARPFPLDPDRTAEYHLGLSLAAAGTTVMLAAAERWLRRAGVGEAPARELALRLAREAIARTALVGAERALTGAVVRGDIGVVRRHLMVARRRRELAFVTALHRETLRLAAASARLETSAARRLEALLHREQRPGSV